MTTAKARINYFGKLPSRGDFVKAGNNQRLLATLDGWLEGAMSQMSEDPRWKITYDAANAQHFAFLGSRSSLAIAGHLAISQDQSGRRFPFIAASTLELEKPLHFAARSPLALSRLWARISSQTDKALATEDSSDALRELAELNVSVEVDAGAYTPHFHDFLEIQTIGALEASLRRSGHELNLRQLIPALGLLLQPVMASGAAKLSKGLALPLPADPVHRYPVAALWLDLIAPFLARASFDISVFIGVIENNAQMVLGFNGAPETTLRAVLDPEIGAQQNININNAEWVQDRINQEYSLQKLDSYLQQPELSLHRARETFREIFIGG